jgi:hypothetical protein
VIYRNGRPFRTLSIDNRVWAAGSEGVSKPCAEFKEEIDASESGWYALYAEGPYSDQQVTSRVSWQCE